MYYQVHDGDLGCFLASAIDETIAKLYASPISGAWEVPQCRQCLYCWHTSEPTRRTQHDACPDSFKMPVEDIAGAL
ncbi:hypothetical protein SRB17_49490 [Streptomyces sp. RB17]|uniref:non-oxidative hydroxyarylic acid decarboxylases subunit D n=1 Tax=Streptomyces sp. RB17 TaxID=2585197 RepID=UPI001296811C|nr:non-oxidative hydroxyarylic acid decarboxylases subunit D [Streptomyces sp. RB17]MQY36947.1 hypothetical protein [Streptomyces sp. RB17]